MRRFLARLFEPFRANYRDAVRLAAENLDLINQREELEKELEASRATSETLQRDNLRLQDRCEVLESDRKEMWDMIRECQLAERTAYRANENVYWQEKGYGVKWADAPSIKQAAEPHMREEQGSGMRMLPSDFERKKTQAFVNTMADKMAERMRDRLVNPGASGSGNN